MLLDGEIDVVDVHEPVGRPQFREDLRRRAGRRPAEEHRRRRDRPRDRRCGGAARHHVTIQPKTYTIPALVDAIAAHYVRTLDTATQ